MCGARLTQSCATCGFANPLTYRFCTRCGGGLRPPATADRAGRGSYEQVRERPAPYAGQSNRERGAAGPDAWASEEGAASQPAPSREEPAAPAAPELALLEGERRVATIILADVSGSTDLMERVGTEAWVEMMNRVFQLLEAEIYRFDGRVDQFRGDGLVAFFGTTVAHEDDPERAVLAALAMQRAIRPYAEELAQKAGIALALRVGVNTGEVIVASVGDDQTYSENTAMGEAIALAARMEQAAEAGTVLVSENTYRLAENQFDWQPLGKIKVKGISQPIGVYRPLAVRPSTERTQDYELANPLIGRDRELEMLLHCLGNLDEGRGGIVLVTGERGMGKSLLLAEVRRHMARQQALLAEIHATDGELSGNGGAPSGEGAERMRIRELRGRARSYDQSQPYAMWQDLLRNWLGIRKDESQEKTRDRLRQQVETLWREEMAEYYPDLARFLTLPLEPALEEQIQHLDAEGQRQRLFLAIRSWIEELTEQAPLVITFSDMHWADATSLELLKYCLPLCDVLDLIWVFVFRPDRRSNVWEFRHHVETEYPHRLVTLNLESLDAEQSRALIDTIIGPDVLPEETEAMIVQKAEGNPFFIQELVRSLIANGTLIRETVTDEMGQAETRWQVTQAVTTLSLPDSLQGLLMARIDRLTEKEQQVLQRASAIGSVFWSKVLDAICTDLPNLKTHLTALQRAQLVAERGRVPDLGVEYTFKSRLTRDAAYDSLLSTQRMGYHRQIAEYLESRFETDLPPQNQVLYYGSLAYHYQHAGLPEKELHYTLKSAERAQEIYANVEASQHYTHALSLLDQLDQEAPSEAATQQLKAQRFQVLMGRHRVYYLMAEFDKMAEDAAELLPLARELPDDPTWLIDALLHQPGVGDYKCRDEVENGIPMAQEALTLSQQIGDQRREMESLIAVINQRLTLSDPDWQKLAERALELAREMNDRNYEARLLVGMGSIYAFSDQPELSMEYLEAAAALAMSGGVEDRVVQMSLLNLLGLEFERNGDYVRLLTEYQQERLHASREIGHRPMESQALQACGRIMGIYLGDHASGLSALEECRRILRGTQDEVYPLFHITQIQIEQADHQEALATLARIEAIGEPATDRAQVSLKLIRAILHNAQGARAATKGEMDVVAEHLNATLGLVEEVVDLAAASPLVSQQYEMAAQCKATVAYMGLSQTTDKPTTRSRSLALALDAAERAYEIYQTFGFAQIVECVSEEVFFRYSQALAANQDHDLALRYLRRAYDEMMRKQALIPDDSHFRRTYAEQVPLHREIRAAYASRVGSILTEANQMWYQVGTN
jgi:predicted ATPase/class 3 adenylate cyclase